MWASASRAGRRGPSPIPLARHVVEDVPSVGDAAPLCGRFEK